MIIMGKQYFLIASIILLSSFSFSGIYDYSFTTIEGSTVAMSSYQQKKIIIITLPVSENAENNLHLVRLDSLSAAHQGNVVMIGVPSIEDGYNSSNSAALRNWYRSHLGSQFIIASGMYTRKSSGNNQDQIFKWLTDKNLNGHFDNDVEGIGNQFFISPTGELYGALGPEAKFSNNVFNRLVQ
jgi:glutathione peroxidase